MSQEEKKSLLNPVGKVTTIQYDFPGIGMMTLGTALIDLSLAPEGTELFVQPSESRLRLEVEVANDNATKWKKALNQQQDFNVQLRIDLREARALLRRCASFDLNPDLNGSIERFLAKD